MVTLEPLPLLEGLSLIYAYVDHDHSEPRVGRMVWTVESVSDEKGARLAKVSLRWDGRPALTCEVVASREGIRVDGALDIKLPLREDDEWRVENEEYPLRRVLSLSSTGRALERDYEGCLEIGLSNEDTDSGRRWYAPGVGLVREDWTGESRNTSLVLVHARFPRR